MAGWYQYFLAKQGRLPRTIIIDGGGEVAFTTTGTLVDKPPPIPGPVDGSLVIDIGAPKGGIDGILELELLERSAGVTFGSSGATEGRLELTLSTAEVVFGTASAIRGRAEIDSSAEVVFVATKVVGGVVVEIDGSSEIVFTIPTSDLGGIGEVGSTSEIVFGATGTAFIEQKLAGTAEVTVNSAKAGIRGLVPTLASKDADILFTAGGLALAEGGLGGGALIRFGSVPNAGIRVEIDGSSEIVFTATGDSSAAGGLGGTLDIVFGSVAIPLAQGGMDATVLIDFDTRAASLRGVLSISAKDNAIVIGTTGTPNGFLSLGASAEILFTSSGTGRTPSRISSSATEIVFGATADIEYPGPITGSAQIVFESSGVLEGFAVGIIDGTAVIDIELRDAGLAGRGIVSSKKASIEFVTAGVAFSVESMSGYSVIRFQSSKAELDLFVRSFAGRGNIVFASSVTLGEISGIAGSAEIVFTVPLADPDGLVGLAGTTQIVFETTGTLAQTFGLSANALIEFESKSAIPGGVGSISSKQASIIFLTVAVAGTSGFLMGRASVWVQMSGVAYGSGDISGSSLIEFDGKTALPGGTGEVSSKQASINFLAGAALFSEGSLGGYTIIRFGASGSTETRLILEGSGLIEFAFRSTSLDGRLVVASKACVISILTSGVLVSRNDVAGSADVVFSSAGNLHQRVFISATSSIVFTEKSATLGFTGTISSKQASIEFGSTATLTGTAATLAGGAEVVLGSTARLVGDFTLSAGATTIIFAVKAASVTGRAPLAGEKVDLVFGASGSVGTTQGLVGDASLQFFASGLAGGQGTIHPTTASIDWHIHGALWLAGNLDGSAVIEWTTKSAIPEATGELDGIKTSVSFGSTGELQSLNRALEAVAAIEFLTDGSALDKVIMYRRTGTVRTILEMTEGQKVRVRCMLTDPATGVRTVREGSSIAITR